MNKFCYCFILFVLFSGNNLAFAQDKVLANEVDSAAIYYDLIAQENYEANYKQNVTGMVVGGSLTGIGVFLVGFGIYAISSVPDNSESSEGLSGALDGLGEGILGTFCVLGSVPFLGVGVPVLIYNIYQYNVRKNHTNRRDEYQNALERYQLQRLGGESSGLQMMLFPSLNAIERRGGLDVLFLF